MSGRVAMISSIVLLARSLACPSCSEAVAQGGGATASSYSASVILLVTAPFVLLSMLFLFIRRQRMKQHAEHREAA